MDNARRNGMDEDSLERLESHLRREAEKGIIWVDSDLWPACEAFQALSGYGLWRYYPTGGLAGFDWQQARNHPLIDWAIDADTWRLVAIMERAAVGVFND